MVCTLHPVIFLFLMGLQTAGLLALIFYRAAESTRWHGLGHFLFFASLLGVGCAAILAVGLRANCWIVLAATLGAMIVGATCDFRQTRRPALG